MENISKQLRLLDTFEYDPLTGLFTSKQSKNGWPKGRSVGSVDASGYVVIWFEGKLCKAHRLAFLMMTGLEPDLIDHIDRVRTNNVFANLRASDKRENALNTSRRNIRQSGDKFVVKLTPAVGKRIVKTFDDYESAVAFKIKWELCNA